MSCPLGLPNGHGWISSLLAVEDVNGDGRLQWGEIRLGADLITLATPEIAGLPYVMSGLVAAGGLGGGAVHGRWFAADDQQCLGARFVLSSPPAPGQYRAAGDCLKFVLMAVALAAAFVASRRSSDILPMVAASFSIAASAFVPVMVLGIFWRGTNRMGAVAGMLSGLGVTLYYMLSHTALAQALFPKAWLANGMWWDIQPVSAAVFGVPVGLVVAIVVSYWKKP